MAAKGFVGIDTEVCKGCNLCVVHCPPKALALDTTDTNSYGLHYAVLTDEQKCNGCMNCALICPDAAVTVYRQVGQPVQAA